MTRKQLSRAARSAAVAGTALSLLLGGAVLASPAQADAAGFTQQELQDICNKDLGALNADLNAEGALTGLPNDPQKRLDYAEKVLKDYSCTFEESSFPSATYTVWDYVGDTLQNCSPGATSPITNQIGDVATKSTSWSVGVSTSTSFPIFDVKFEMSKTWGTQTSTENRFTVTVNPGRKVRATVGTEYQDHYGRLRVNFGNRERGHYIWYLNGVTMAAPTGNAQQAQKGMVESACREALPPADQADNGKKPRVFLLGSG
ncbi:hypothetical protein [Kitasatospora indigofera]|uniref:hypothetical protein n=1 Tax=Kitasatospora indigofera TaxID=67307 RepID=UPI00367474A4